MLATVKPHRARTAITQPDLFAGEENFGFRGSSHCGCPSVVHVRTVLLMQPFSFFVPQNALPPARHSLLGHPTISSPPQALCNDCTKVLWNRLEPACRWVLYLGCFCFCVL